MHSLTHVHYTYIDTTACAVLSAWIDVYLIVHEWVSFSPPHSPSIVCSPNTGHQGPSYSAFESWWTVQKDFDCGTNETDSVLRLPRMLLETRTLCGTRFSTCGLSIQASCIKFGLDNMSTRNTYPCIQIKSKYSTFFLPASLTFSPRSPLLCFHCLRL